MVLRPPGKKADAPSAVACAAPSPAWRFCLATLLTGLAAGAAGVVVTLLLHAVQHAAFGYTEDTFLVGVQHAGALRRVLALAIGGALAGVGWWWYRRNVHGTASVAAAVSARDPRLSMRASVTDAALQIFAVGVGASLGREGAPRQVGAALGGGIAARLGLDREQRRVLLAAGAGAGLAAVYNVPLGGAAFALEILLSTARPISTVRPGPVLAAILTSTIATVVAWPVLGNRPTYRFPNAHLGWTVLAAALVLGPAAGLVGIAFRTAMTSARRHAFTGWHSAMAVPIVFTGLGATAIAYPQLLGNGKSLAQLAFDGSLTLGLAAALSVLKPLATAACLGSGAIGGLLTPSFATGATLGLAGGTLWSHLWPGGEPAAYALLGAGALLTVTQRAPLTAVILTVEFTHAGLVLLPALVVAVAGAYLTDRLTTHLRQRNSGSKASSRSATASPPGARPGRPT